MGWRFRKRVKVAPGINLNFSKNGTSVTIGGKGASVNIGKKGVYGNIGIPGTGIYSREKIVGTNKKDKTAQQYQQHQRLVTVDPIQIQKTNEEIDTKESVIGLLSVIICFIGGLIIGFKTGYIWLGIGICILPFIYIIIKKALKS
jgi:hypothetical protein